MKAFENSVITIVEGDAQALENLTTTIRSWGFEREGLFPGRNSF